MSGGTRLFYPPSFTSQYEPCTAGNQTTNTDFIEFYMLSRFLSKNNGDLDLIKERLQEAICRVGDRDFVAKKKWLVL